MADVEKTLANLHQQAIALTAAASKPTQSELVPIAQKLARRLNQLVIMDRPMALALLAIYCREHQPSSQWIVKVGTLTALLAHELGYLEDTSEALVRAAITMDLSVQDILSARFNSQALSSEMKKRWPAHSVLTANLLKKAGVTDELWLAHVLQHHERLNGKGYPHRLSQNQILPTALLIGLANDALELMMPTAKRHGLDPDKVLSRMYMRRGYYLRSHITALANLLQPVPLGAQVKLSSGGIALILRKPGKDYVWAVQPVNRPRQSPVDVIKLEKPDVERVFPMLKLDKPNLMATWLEGHKQMSNNQKHFWLDPIPAPSKLKVQLNKLLSDEQPNITRVTQYIASEPALIEVLTDMANRQIAKAKPTKDIKHSIMMVGLERLGPMLMRSDLLIQCRNRRFPLDYWAYQYLLIFSECTAQLATRTYFMMPEQARTLATFAACGWLFDEELKQQRQLESRLKDSSDINSLFELLTSTSHQEVALHGVAMAKQWQLSLSLEAALEVFAQLKEPEDVTLKSRHPYYLLELASHLTIQLLGKNSSWHERTVLMTRLDISNEQYQEAKEAVMACGCVFSPLLTG